MNYNQQNTYWQPVYCKHIFPSPCLPVLHPHTGVMLVRVDAQETWMWIFMNQYIKNLLLSRSVKNFETSSASSKLLDTVISLEFIFLRLHTQIYLVYVNYHRRYDYYVLLLWVVFHKALKMYKKIDSLENSQTSSLKLIFPKCYSNFQFVINIWFLKILEWFLVDRWEYEKEDFILVCMFFNISCIAIFRR